VSCWRFVGVSWLGRNCGCDLTGRGLRLALLPRQRCGTSIAEQAGMGANDFTELICWQLAHELNRFIWPSIERPEVKRHRKLCEQMEDAAGSAPRNIAEGFGRYDHKEFAHFIKVALASEHETRANLIEACDKGFITQAERDAGLLLAKRAIAAAAKFRRYLMNNPTPAPKKEKSPPPHNPE
jgi:four helix bundle protein